MHHDFWMTTILRIVIGKALLNPVWNYGKKLVQNFAQAAALYWLVVNFVVFFAASYVSEQRPVGAARGA